MKKSFISFALIILVFAVCSVSANAQQKAKAAKSTISKKSWLNGTWLGTGYQVDDDSKWTINFTAKTNKYRIEYPSLSCGGEWYLTSVDSKKAVFKENITFGSDKCTDNGTVTLEKVNSTQLSFRYSNPNTSKVNATAVLDKKSFKQ